MKIKTKQIYYFVTLFNSEKQTKISLMMMIIISKGNYFLFLKRHKLRLKQETNILKFLFCAC